jgi:hypothetical protein
VAAMVAAFLHGWKMGMVLLLVFPVIAIASHLKTRIVERHRQKHHRLMQPANDVSKVTLLCHCNLHVWIFVWWETIHVNRVNSYPTLWPHAVYQTCSGTVHANKHYSIFPSHPHLSHIIFRLHSWFAMWAVLRPGGWCIT